MKKKHRIHKQINKSGDKAALSDFLELVDYPVEKALYTKVKTLKMENEWQNDGSRVNKVICEQILEMITLNIIPPENIIVLGLELMIRIK